VCHHGKGLFLLTKDQAFVDAIKDDYATANIDERDRKMLDYAVKLTKEPCEVDRADVEELRSVRFSDADILDMVQIVGYYAFVNRLACGLGVDLEDYWEKNKTAG
jgi:uncharacterized peroxidase-related enzyme